MDERHGVQDNPAAAAVSGTNPAVAAELQTRTVKQTAEQIGRSVSTVRRMIRHGQLPAVRVGSGRGRPEIPETAIVEYMTPGVVR
ncbi:helix-turn-helix domain-containing protein [Amycolatopsis sp. NPDC059657]|uniref:helix-turn-helix domain-containing protein n=1 Tax=Amycolatopsis sp. NPDC059657 TaxID=3346899 RepID=UPI00366CBDAF